MGESNDRLSLISFCQSSSERLPLPPRPLPLSLEHGPLFRETEDFFVRRVSCESSKKLLLSRLIRSFSAPNPEPSSGLGLSSVTMMMESSKPQPQLNRLSVWGGDAGSAQEYTH